MTENECTICIQQYTKTTRKQVECPKCNTSFCTQCIKKYITDSSNICCLSCSGEWDFAFLCEHLTKKFMTSEYKKLQEKKLLDKELALIPDTMYLIDLLNDNKVLKKRIIKLYETIEAINTEIKSIREEIFVNESEIYGNSVRKIKKNTIDGPCPTEDCRGFIDIEKHSCAVCKIVICKSCREIKTEEHECKQENIESAKLIRKDSKPCPNCSVFIFKIDGCDQMWCSQCQTAFSWITGLIETGKIHNPHYYEWQRKVNNGEIARDPMDNNCNELPTLYHINSLKLDARLKLYVLRVHRMITHIQNVITPYLFVERDNKILRIDYILNKITKEQFAKELQVRDKSIKKNIELLNCINLYCQVTIEMFHKKEISSIVEEEPKIREFVNERLKNIGKMFNCSVTKYIISYTLN